MAIEVFVPSAMAMLEFLLVEVAVGFQLPAAVTLRSSTGKYKIGAYFFLGILNTSTLQAIVF